jgi:hypothetical protein
LFQKQIDKKTCSMSEGPNCFQLSNIGDLTYSDYLKKIIERLESANASISVKDLLTILKQELTKFKEKNKSSLSEVFKFKPKIMMNLLLNFESFDQTTKTKDVYMPDERVINFNVGYLKLNFKGKLRLTADRDRNRMALGEKIPDGPKDSYGIIEDRDLIIKFDKPVIIKHFFIRPHRGVHEETDIYIGPPAKIVGYRYDIEIVTSNLNIANYQWVFYLLTLVQSQLLK